MRLVCIRLVVLALLLSASATWAAELGPAAPDAPRLRALSAALDSARFVRVTARTFRLDTSRATADSAGVHVEKVHGRSALFVMGAIPASDRERVIPWRDVESIDVGRGSHSGRALAIGVGSAVVLIGLAAGLGKSGAIEDGSNADYALIYGVSFASLGCVLGGVFAATMPPRLESVYP